MNRVKKRIYFLDLFLACGLLIYSIIIYLTNKKIGFELASGSEILTKYRILGQKLGSIICAIVGSGYIIGLLVVMKSIIWEKVTIIQFGGYFLIQVFFTIMSVGCVAVFDFKYIWDYFFQIWWILSWEVICFVYGLIRIIQCKVTGLKKI